MLLLPLLGVFIIYLITLFISDLRTEKSELSELKGVIKNVRQYEYYDPEIIKGKKTYDVLEIYLTNDLIIRLSDGFEKKYWTEINNVNNIGKKIKILFHKRLLRNSIVLNPQELIIGEHKIMTLEAYKIKNLWIVLSFSFLLLFISYLEYWLVKNYMRLHFKEDNSSNSPLIWTIIKNGFSRE